MTEAMHPYEGVMGETVSEGQRENKIYSGCINLNARGIEAKRLAVYQDLTVLEIMGDGRQSSTHQNWKVRNLRFSKNYTLIMLILALLVMTIHRLLFLMGIGYSYITGDLFSLWWHAQVE